MVVGRFPSDAGEAHSGLVPARVSGCLHPGLDRCLCAGRGAVRRGLCGSLLRLKWQREPGRGQPGTTAMVPVGPCVPGAVPSHRHLFDARVSLSVQYVWQFQASKVRSLKQRFERKQRIGKRPVFLKVCEE